MTGSLQIKNDLFYAVLNFKDKNGKRKQKWIPLQLPVKGNKRKAESILQKLIMQYQELEYIEPVKMLLSQYIEKWIERDKAHVTVTTYNQYVNMLKLHIAPYFDSRGITVVKVTYR